MLLNGLIVSLDHGDCKILSSGRASVRTAINTAMVSTYWQIGKLIVEEEQRGAERADYDKQLLTSLSKRLSEDFRKGFGETNLNQIETQSGRILKKVTGSASTVGSSTHEFNVGNVLYSKLRPYLNKVGGEG